VPPMRTFNGFFSYAHFDAKASPSLIEALTTKLETLVTAKLINADLSIFYDATRLHTGDRWDPTIDKALRQSDILILLFTPSWLQSEYCRKELLVFEEVERSYGGGGYVVPILARPIGGQEQHLTSEQRLVHESLKDRQYFPMLASDFLQLDENARQKALEEVGDDIVGILERRRDLTGSASTGERPLSPKRTAAEWRYTRSIQEFEKVDFISDEEVVIDQARDGQPRGIYAQIDFAERLSVEGNHGNNIVFSVRQAYLTVENEGPGELFQADDLRDPHGQQNAFFVRMYDAPHAISICIDPAPGKIGLAELALPPASGENRLSRVATATTDVEASKVKAELRVTLDAKGLNFPADAKVSQAKRSQITAIILEAARKRHQVTEKGEIHRSISVRERD
jgi:hypothetical protein